jgi:UDP-GlcNAc:undecaprenyl-phosphate GlcNAc-1-phosphate transferase
MFLSLVFAAAVALTVCLAAHPIARALGVIDVPDGRRKLHATPTPQVGGIAAGLPLLLVLGWLAVSTVFLPLFTGIAVATAGFLILGLIDDRNHVRPLFRLVISVAFAALIVWLVPAEQVTFFRFTFLEVALFPQAWAAMTFTVLCIVGLQNALNMADGKNGLAVGLLLTWTALMLGYAPAHVLPALAALIGALAVVFAFNVRGLLFLGDAGTYGLSVAVALLALHVYAVGFPVLHADVVALWFLIPIVDALRLMATRVIGGHSPFSADRRHLHHVLQRTLPAWPPGGRLGLYLGLVAVPGALAIPYPELTLLWGLVELSVYGTLLVLSRVSQARAGSAHVGSQSRTQART